MASQGEEAAVSEPPEQAKLAEENKRLRHELDEALSSMAVAECVKESMVELERQKTSVDEELATMQQLLNEAHDEASATRTRYEHHLAKTKAIVNQLEHENHELKIHLKLGHPAGGGGDASVLDKDTILGGAAVLSDATKSFARRMKSNLMPVTSNSPSQPANEKSPSPVAPVPPVPPNASANLEEGMRKAYEDTELLKAIIVPLEEQIGALKDKLREADTLLRQHEEKQSEVLLGVDGLTRWLEGKTVEEAMAEMVEKSADGEIEEGKLKAQQDLYIGLMSTRYSLLNRELTSLRKEHAEVVNLLDRERLTVKQLKQESVITNSEMVKVQREHLSEVARIQNVLTEDQKVELMQQSSPPLKGGSPQPPPSESNTSSNDSSPSHNANTGGDNSEDEEAKANAAPKIVSNVEWQEMQKELEKVRALLGVGAGDSVVGSDQYRALKTELLDMKKQKAMCQKNVDKLKEEMKSEDVYRKQLEEKWNELGEEHRTEIETYTKQVKTAESLLDQLRVSYSTMYEATRKDLQLLTADREKIVRELKRLQDEVDILTGKHTAKAQEMQNEVINLPDKSEDMQLVLLKFREDLIAVKVAKERLEEKMNGEVSFLKTQLAGEEDAKKAIEDGLTQEIDSLRSNMSQLKRYKAELEVEQKKAKERELAEAKQNQTLSSMQREVEEMKAERQKSEAKQFELKNRISNLQQELDNSVAVQTDFVRLSQSLQMELEKIRQSEKEVRWQHEDDINTCQNCKISLSGNRRKHHCRHCGRIFCSDCVSKHVPSGPRQRPAKVCDVCHTLLVQDSAPYFSTEAPMNN